MNPTPTPKFLENNAAAFANERWIRMLQRGQYMKLTKEFCYTFQHFADYSYATMPDEKYAVLNAAVGQFLFAMSRSEYQLPDRLVDKLIELNPAIANAVAMSKYQTTDEVLNEIIGHPSNFYKILVLYSARNRNVIKPERFFRMDPTRASLWYWSYFVAPGSYPSATVFENMKRHVNYVDPDLQLLDASALIAYFNSTYIDNIGYRGLKAKINALVQEKTAGIKIDNTPDGTIAICTSKWYPNSAVYRCVAKGIRALSKRRRLELIHLGDWNEDVDRSMFAAVKTVRFNGKFLDLSQVTKNSYSAVFFPDIGMNFEGLYLSNIRLAPSQIMSYGHPSSTFGAKIDYFIGGEAIEIPEDAERNYSEKLVLIPGNGQPSTRPGHLDERVALENKAPHVRPDRVVVNCPWSQDKTTFPLIDCLRKIKDACRSKVLFRFFPNEAVNRMNYFIPYVQGIGETMGALESVEIHQAFGQDYMNRMAAGDLALDSWPFNGYNTIIDSLLLGVPVVSLRGRQCFERVGADLLERVGLKALVAESEQEFIDKAVALIDNPEWRQLCKTDINAEALAFNADDGEAFAAAILRRVPC